MIIFNKEGIKLKTLLNQKYLEFQFWNALSQKHGPKHKVFVTSFFFAFLMNVKQIATKQLLGVPAFDKKVQFCPKNIGWKWLEKFLKNVKTLSNINWCRHNYMTCTILQLFFVIIQLLFIKSTKSQKFLSCFLPLNTHVKNGYVKLYTMFIFSKK